MTNELNELEVREIKNLAKEKLGLCSKTNDIIGTQIFSILSMYARVIYYPLGQEAPWGFTRISGSRDDAALEKPFVAINSSISMDRQVFAAAHELYHIWFEQNPDILPADLLNEQKTLCLFYDNPEAGAVYHKLGFKTIGKWKMIVRQP